MALKWDKKDPDEVLDYMINWSDRLDGGDTIVSSDWVGDAGITLGSEVFTDTTTTLWLSGGTNGTTYKLTNTVVTAGGRTMQEAVNLTVKSV